MVLVAEVVQVPEDEIHGEQVEEGHYHHQEEAEAEHRDVGQQVAEVLPQVQEEEEHSPLPLLLLQGLEAGEP